MAATQNKKPQKCSANYVQFCYRIRCFYTKYRSVLDLPHSFAKRQYFLKVLFNFQRFQLFFNYAQCIRISTALTRNRQQITDGFGQRKKPLSADQVLSYDWFWSSLSRHIVRYVSTSRKRWLVNVTLSQAAAPKVIAWKSGKRTTLHYRKYILHVK